MKEINDLKEKNSELKSIGMDTKPLGARLGEGIFCIAYLVYTLYLLFVMKNRYDAGIAASGGLSLIPENMDTYRYCFGFMLAALLVGGDSFHLIPRIIVCFRGSMPKQDFFLGLGNLISSVTMTLFYNVLIGMGDTLEFNENMYNLGIERVILFFTLIRLIILFLPWNDWFKGKSNLKWAVIRNVPFTIIGFLTVVGLFDVMAHANNYNTGFYNLIILSVIGSFIFYMPVALFGKEKPKLGILMIPKTICYMVMLSVICFF